ncbi:hypothetical protein [Oscillibacter ruminantium]|uniref:hypothetical protein n=1 Tax=Oscillibacter ruminantium TaxID=1263547 RepID=UPI00333159A8
MTKYNLSIEAKEGELEQIMKELDAAQETICNCYWKLQKLGVLTIKKEETASGN